MASHRVGETGLSESGPSNHPTSNPFINQRGSTLDFGELEQAIILQRVKIGHDHESNTALFRPAATMEMFPSWPMRFQQVTTTREGSSKSGGESTDSESGVNTLCSTQVEGLLDQQRTSQNQSALKMIQEKRQGRTRSEKVLDAKTLRRLAQNREAAKKSRLRKKAYVQQLESSRIKLAQLEQEIQRARSQGLFLGGAAGAPANISSGAAIFDMEYARWLEDDHKLMSEIRTALQSHLSDGDLRFIVDAYISHYDDVFQLKAVAAKSDVFHLITGMWTTPAERCFQWMAGFKPSELIKMLIGQLEPLTEQQLMGIYSLQRSSQQAEEGMTQNLEQLQRSLVETIATSTVVDGMHQMALALAKLSNLEAFIHQADSLRQQTLHQMRRILTIRQAARCFLVIGEYYGRLRALSSIWASRPRETMMNEESIRQTAPEAQMVQTSHSHFSPF